MIGKEWLAPAAAALVTFGALWAFAPTAQDAPHDADDGVDFVFADPPRIASANGSVDVLILSQDAQILDDVWRSPHVGVLHSSSAIALCLHYNPCVATHEIAAPTEPRFGEGGYNATRVTVHVFDATGQLVLSNGNTSELARLVHGLSPDALPSGTWYVGGNATPPAGTQRLPLFAAAFFAQVWPLLQGLPEGGVASLESSALAGLYGPVWLTLRIDALVFAP